MGALFSKRNRAPNWASDATTGEDLAFYLQLDLEHEPRDVCELGPGPSGGALRFILAMAEAKSLRAVELSEKNRSRLAKAFAKEISAGALTILPSSPALADASIDIMYGLRSCCESYGPAGNSSGAVRATATRAWRRTGRCARQASSTSRSTSRGCRAPRGGRRSWARSPDEYAIAATHYIH